jgi:Flp pilus assembly protein TadG
MRSIRRTPRSDRRRSRLGAATVETALVLPIFFMVMVGIVEIGRAFMVSQLLTNAAREGGRIAAMNGSTNSEVIQTVKDVAEKTAGLAPGDVQVTITITEASGNPETSDNVASANKRDLCEVVARVDYDKVNLLPIKYLVGSQLIGQAAMRHE